MDKKTRNLELEAWLIETTGEEMMANHLGPNWNRFNEEMGFYPNISMTIADQVWQHQQAKVEELQKQLIDQGQRFNDQSQRLKDLEHKNGELQKRVDYLERQLSIKTRHCEFFERSRIGHRSLAITRKLQIDKALNQIEALYTEAEKDYEKDHNPYYDGMLSALDLAEQAIRGELGEQALKGEV